MTTIKQYIKNRRNRKQRYFNGIWVPQDRGQWSDQLEREILKSLQYWR